MEKEYNYKLFPSKEDQDKFYKILAELFLESSEKQKQELLDELESLQTSCGKILETAGVGQNIVAQIIQKNAEINDTSSQKTDEEIASLKEERSQLYDKLLDIIHGLETKHETLTTGEDLERDANKAFDRQEKTISIKQKQQEVRKIIDGETITHEEMLSSYPFKQIRKINGIAEEKNEETVKEETITGITEAPESLLDKAFPKVEEPTKEEIASSPVLTDNSFFASDDELKEAIEQTPDVQVEDAKEDISKVEPETTTDEPDGIALLDEITREKESTSAPLTKDIIIPDDTEETTIELNDDNSLTYELTSGVSLSDVAESAYYDKATWKKLYEFNKKAIDEKLNGTPIEAAKDDKNILSGLIIRVPFTLDAIEPKKEEVKKVA